MQWVAINQFFFLFLQKLSIFIKLVTAHAQSIIQTDAEKRAVNKTENSCHSSNMAVLNSQIKDYQTLCHLKLHLMLHSAYLTGSNVSLAVDFYFQCTPLT